MSIKEFRKALESLTEEERHELTMICMNHLDDMKYNTDLVTKYVKSIAISDTNED